MLEIQKYLKSNPLSSIFDRFCIRTYEHPSLPLVGFKYHQINSPKTNPVVREARGIVLEKGTWRVVAKPFTRFFNIREHQEEWRQFNWSDFEAIVKEDGSLMIMYFYNGDWHVNTSGSFGFGKIGDSSKAWNELFWDVADFHKMPPEGTTYIFELCSPYNKVVRTYMAPTLYLIGANKVEDDEIVEYSEDDLDQIAEDFLNCWRPKRYNNFKGKKEEGVKQLLQSIESKDATFEGFVLRDSNNLRFKWKTDAYLSLHRLKNNGNILSPKNVVPIVLAGETDEVITYFPEMAPVFDKATKELADEFNKLVKLWGETKDIESQKEFALSVIDSPFSSILFNIRKTHDGGSVEVLGKIWRDSADLIIKKLYNN